MTFKLFTLKTEWDNHILCISVLHSFRLKDKMSVKSNVCVKLYIIVYRNYSTVLSNSWRHFFGSYYFIPWQKANNINLLGYLSAINFAQKTSNFHIFKTSLKEKMFVSCSNECHLVNHKIMNFLWYLVLSQSWLFLYCSFYSNYITFDHILHRKSLIYYLTGVYTVSIPSAYFDA